MKSYHIKYMEKYKKSYKKSKFKILAPTWNDKFELPDGSYSVTNTIFNIITSMSSRNMKQRLVILQ